MANAITVVRILCSLVMLGTTPFSLPFYTLYLLAGISDMIDGYVARQTNTVSELGRKLDSIADIVFIIVCLFKLLPSIHLSMYYWIWIGGIAILKIGNAWIKRKLFSHSIGNKVTGFLLFIYPFFINTVYFTLLLCLIATLSTLQEIFLEKKE